MRTSLSVSVLLRPVDVPAGQWPWLPLLVGVAAVEAVRAERTSFVETGSEDYVWWVVRQPGEQLAQFIADSKSDKEFVLDLATGQLVEV